MCTDSGEIDVGLQPLAGGVDGRAGILAAVGLLKSFDEEDASDIADQVLGRDPKQPRQPNKQKQKQKNTSMN